MREAMEAHQKAEAEAAAAKQVVAELKAKIDASFAALGMSRSLVVFPDQQDAKAGA